MKKLFSCLVIFVILLAALGAGIYLFGNVVIGGAVENGVRTAGPLITGTSVNLDACKVALLRGNVDLERFTVGNPQGFKTSHALQVGTVHLDAQPKSALEQPVIINEILISDVEATWEGSLRGSNLTRIQKNIEAFIGESQTTESEEPPVKVIIKRLRITNIRLRVSSTVLQGKGISKSLSDIELTDLGAEKGGITTAEVLEKVTPIFFKEIAKVAATVGVGTAVGGPIGGAVAIPVTEGVKTGVTKVKEGIGGLFRKLRGGTTEEETAEP